MKTYSLLTNALLLAVFFTCPWQIQAQPFIVSTVPGSAATGVSPSAAVIFTFSEAMNTNASATSVQFLVVTPFSFLATANTWNSDHTVLTCTPTPAFPSNNTIFWTVTGENPGGDPLDGTTSDFFNTGGGAGGTGSGTNQFTTFTVGKVHVFDQTSTAVPVLDSTVPYEFVAQTTLSSNRTATSITLTLPSSAVTNLSSIPFQPETFALYTLSTNLAALDATYSAGSYLFSVTGSSNQQVTVSLPALAQPNAPRCANFTAAQSVNPTQAFLLSWDAFSGGTSADYIFVDVGEVFKTPNPGVAGALNGTVTSVNIPANTLQANSNYDASIGFYHAVAISNSTYTTIAYIGTVTRFSLMTPAAAGVILRLTNSAWSSNIFSFDVLAPAGQTITAESSSTLQPNSWTPILTTNTPVGGRVHVTDPHSVSNRFLFYHARTGS